MINKSTNFSLIQIKIKLLITILFVGVLLSLVISSTVMALSESKGNRRNMFYVQLLNYTLPMVKVSTFDEGDMAENEFSLKSEALKLAGIDNKNPMSILGREVACIKEYYNGAENVDSNEEIKSIDVALKPFNLSEASVNKNDPQQGLSPTDTNTNPGNTGSDPIPSITVNPSAPTAVKPNSNGKPEVFIYHTHTTEGYGTSKDVTDPNKNVCAVGIAMEKELESKYGISVIHDMTIHDAPAYNASYKRSGATIDKYLKQYGNFRLIIDIHRDEVNKRSSVTTKINGEDVARFMFVVDKSNAHYKQNLALVNKMVGISEKLFPGYIRSAKDGKGIYAYNSGNSHFNQDKGTNSVLIEVGSEVSTPSEAAAAGKYLARIVAEGLNGKN